VKFLCDESVDGPIVDRLRLDGQDIWYVAEMDPGLSDDAVLAIANREGAVLITADKDFGELVFRLRRPTAGVVLYRLTGLPATRKATIVASAIACHSAELAQAFTVITAEGLRIRHAFPT
jgi:predicted nuclease of predicted toxin-antitoxin system